MEVTASHRQQLIRAARAAMKHAYAPYSNFRVGAAILLRDERVFSGCNVENASYGLTICAERNAIFSAVAQSSKKPEIVAAAVVNHRGVSCSPCGACRQVMAEFGPSAVVWYPGPNGIIQRTMRELLVDGFSLCPNEPDATS
ncbi:MAG TPA: cytidine deaminase [Verrucomicrobiae bacterium]|jgi:cytidine deaminase